MIISQLDYSRLKKSVRSAKAHRIPAAGMERLLQSGKASIVDSSQIPPDVVTMNSVLRIRYLIDQKTIDIRIVYPDQADITQNRISILAPMATSLLGRRKDEVLSLQLPQGATALVQIDRILYQPEAAGNFSL
jgi:regulator of nucleoside diphosphate kinase